MATINLATANLLKAKTRVGLSVAGGVSEPWFDYDDNGEPIDCGFDLEPDAEDTVSTAMDDQIFDVAPSQFAETAIRIPEAGKVSDFSFEGREYLRQIYDTQSKRVLLKCGRQVEKCCAVRQSILLHDGKQIEAGAIRVGDRVVTMSNDGTSTTTGAVTWVSRRYTKPCRKITTRQGHATVIAITHPVRQWGTWSESGELRKGDRLAVLRSGGEFTGVCKYSQQRIKLTSYMIGDGSVASGGYGFTQIPGPVLDEFVETLISLQIDFGWDAQVSNAKQMHVNKTGSVLHEWMTEDGLDGHTAHDKFIPSWVFDLSREDTALFINCLWATDGHVKQNTRSKYSLEYCSVSYKLIRELQALLWKFGIPSKIRKNWPNYWKKKKIKKYAFILRIETREGISTFLEQISCLGKSEHVPLPERSSNSNRDTYPI